MLNRLKSDRHLMRAERYFAHGQYDKARSEFDKAAELAPGNPAVHLRYAVFLSETNDLISAVSHVERALEKRPDSAPYNLFYGIILFDYGRYDEAKEHFDKAGQLNPQSQLARGYKALVNIAQGNIETGLKELKSAGLTQNSGFHARALVILERLVRLERGAARSTPLKVDEISYETGGIIRNWRARNLLSEGIHLLDLNKWEEAVNKFRHARALSPDLIEARFQEGVAFFMAGDYEQSEKIMAELADEAEEPLLYLAASMAEQGRFEDSVKILKRIEKPTPEYHYYLGLYLLSVKQDREARHHFEQAVSKCYDLLRHTLDKACEAYQIK